MKIKIALGIVAAIAVVLLFHWDGHEVLKIEAKQQAQNLAAFDQYNATHPLPTFIFLQTDLCYALQSSDKVGEDYSKIDSGLLLDQDVLPDYKKLNDSVGSTLGDIKDSIVNLPGDPPSSDELSIESKVKILRNALNKSYLHLELGAFQTARTSFAAVPKTLVSLGATGCESPVPTISPVPASSTPSPNEFGLSYRDFANDSVCKLRLDIENVLVTMPSGDSVGAKRSVLINQLKILADQLQEASQSTGWASQESLLPTDKVNIQTFQDTSDAIYRLRVKYYLGHAPDVQSRFKILSTTISPLAVLGCSKIKG